MFIDKNFLCPVEVQNEKAKILQQTTKKRIPQISYDVTTNKKNSCTSFKNLSMNRRGPSFSKLGQSKCSVEKLEVDLTVLCRDSPRHITYIPVRYVCSCVNLKALMATTSREIIKTLKLLRNTNSFNKTKFQTEIIYVFRRHINLDSSHLACVLSMNCFILMF